MSLVARIKDLTAEKGLNIKLLEKAAGFGNGTIRRWDDSSPSADKLLKVANLLNTTTDFLLTGVNDKDERILSIEDREWLALIHKLPVEAQYEFRGEIKGYLKRLGDESPETEEPLRQAK
jgi:transcriptional regulator with XRE-family HTH domain